VRWTTRWLATIHRSRRLACRDERYRLAADAPIERHRVTSVPASLTLFDTGEYYQRASRWASALDDSLDMAPGRRDYLGEQLDCSPAIPPLRQLRSLAQVRSGRPASRFVPSAHTVSAAMDVIDLA
jgi:hypothetical protein